MTAGRGGAGEVPGRLVQPRQVVYHVYMSLPRPLCARISRELESELERVFFEQQWNPSEGLRRILLEWLAVQKFPRMEFRETRAGRRAALRGGPEVWEVAAAAGPGRAMSAAVGQRFAGTRTEALEEALAYAKEYAGQIDPIVAREERIARL
ncbi:hypothetical protein [Candidatus Palauibacter sp.]|uniref:hypothetical protein n=1 Tax=Candidatus Palauibacter sp. TaxID=3101350 RepID=UPI003B01EB6D